MGFFSNLTQKIVSSPKNPLNILTTAIQHPIKFIGAEIQSIKTLSPSPVNTLISNTIAQPTSKQVGNIVANTATAGSLLLAPELKLLTPVAVVASSTIPRVVGASPNQSLKIAGKTTEGLPNFATNIGEFIENPSLSNATDIFKENPVIAGLATGAAVLGLAKGLPAVAGYVAGKIGGESAPAPSVTPFTGGGTLPTEKPKPIDTDEGIPATPETTTIQTGKKKRRHKTPNKPQNVTQRVNIVFDNDYIDNKNKRFK